MPHLRRTDQTFRLHLLEFFSDRFPCDPTSVSAAASDQIVVRPGIDQTALFQKQNAVDTLECGYPMGNQNDDARTKMLSEAIRDFAFCLSIDGAEGVVQDENVGVGRQRT